MTLQDYIDQFRNLLDEDDPENSFWTDEQLIDWFNEGYYDVARRAKYLTERAYIDPADEREYQMPDNFIDAYKVKGDGKFLKRVPIEDEEHYEGYYIWGQNLYLTEKMPTGIKLTLYYYRTPDKRLKDMSDEPEIPAEYETVVIPYIAYKALLKDQRHEEARVYAEEYQQRLQGMMRRFAKTPDRKQWAVVR